MFYDTLINWNTSERLNLFFASSILASKSGPFGSLGSVYSNRNKQQGWQQSRWAIDPCRWVVVVYLVSRILQFLHSLQVGGEFAYFFSFLDNARCVLTPVLHEWCQCSMASIDLIIKEKIISLQYTIYRLWFIICSSTAAAATAQENCLHAELKCYYLTDAIVLARFVLVNDVLFQNGESLDEAHQIIISINLDWHQPNEWQGGVAKRQWLIKSFRRRWIWEPILTVVAWSLILL